MLVRMRRIPPTDSMDMAGKSSTARSGDTGVSGARRHGCPPSPHGGSSTQRPRGLTWRGEGNQQGPTGVEGAETWGRRGQSGHRAPGESWQPCAHVAPSTLTSPGCPTTASLDTSRAEGHGDKAGVLWGHQGGHPRVWGKGGCPGTVGNTGHTRDIWWLSWCPGAATRASPVQAGPCQPHPAWVPR